MYELDSRFFLIRFLLTLIFKVENGLVWIKRCLFDMEFSENVVIHLPKYPGFSIENRENKASKIVNVKN